MRMVYSRASSPEQTRVLCYYLPVAIWLERQVKIGKRDGKTGAVCVGFTIPQGGGKTTITNCLMVAMKALNVKTAVVSIDDFYYTYNQQLEVGVNNSDNAYLRGRGVAGTHSIQLGVDVLDDMISN